MNLPEPQKVRRVRPKPRLAEVVRVERLTPHMVRVVFAGEELEGFTTRGPAEHLKVNFPPPGEAKLVLPEWGPGGPILLEGQQRPLNRTYTPRRWDREAGELAVDFLLHGEGPGSTWAQQARPGQLIAVSHQPGGAYKVDAEANWYLIGGDEAALPAVGNAARRVAGVVFRSCLCRGGGRGRGAAVGVFSAVSGDVVASRPSGRTGWAEAGRGGARIHVPGGRRQGLDRLRSRRHA